MLKYKNQQGGIGVKADTPEYNAPLHRPLMLSYDALTHALNW